MEYDEQYGIETLQKLASQSHVLVIDEGLAKLICDYHNALRLHMSRENTYPMTCAMMFNKLLDNKIKQKLLK